MHTYFVIFCNNFSSQWYLYAVCATQYLLGFHVCGGEDPLIVAHIKQGFRGKRPKPDLICSWMWELGLWEGAVISMCLFVEAREERIPTEHSWCELRPHLQVLWVSCDGETIRRTVWWRGNGGKSDLRESVKINDSNVLLRAPLCAQILLKPYWHKLLIVFVFFPQLIVHF